MAEGEYMTIKKSRHISESNEQMKHELFCNSLEQQYIQAKDDGIFEILKILELDRQHSEPNMVEAVDYFNEKDGAVGKDAPMEFLGEQEKNSVNRGGVFRPALYCMFLSQAFAKAIENKTIFMKHSLKYSFESEAQ